MNLEEWVDLNDIMSFMEDIVAAIKKNLEDKNYYSALFLTLILPSICGALESDNGKDTRDKYINWYDLYVYGLSLKGEDCYYLRCSLLHQGVTSHHASSFSRVMFSFPSNNIIHNVQIDDVLILDIPLFCQKVLQAVEMWFEDVKNDENFKKNILSTISLHANGLPPYISGIPVIY